MKVYNRKDFINLPKNTIYSRVYNRGEFEGLFCKTSELDNSPHSLKNDWYEQDLIGELGFKPNSDDGTESYIHFTQVMEKGLEFETDLDLVGRDGMFDDEDLFVVWNKNDVKKLIHYLGEAIGEYM